MKVVALVGSPRAIGNTSLLVQEVLKGAADKGADTKVYYLNQLNIKGCQSCMSCKTNPACAVDDDGKQILNDIADADAIVLGTPVYAGYMSGQMKLFMDRFFSFMNLDHTCKLESGKKALWAVTQSAPDEDAFVPAFENASMILKRLGYEYKIIVASGMRVPGELLNRESVVAKAYSLGEWLVQ